MRRLILLMAVMGTTVLLASGVAYALSVQCDGVGDQDPDPGECRGTNQDDDITGSQQNDDILALGGRDKVSARGGDDFVFGRGGHDDILGGVGGDRLVGGFGPDDIDGGPGTTDVPRNTFECQVRDPGGGLVASVEANQVLFGGDDQFIFPVPSDDGNDDLDGGRDNDFLAGGSDTNDLSGNGGDDCLVLDGDENERASGGYGDDIIFSDDSGADSSNGDDIFCGAGIDTVRADAQDRVAAGCENVIRPSSLQAPGATPEAEVTLTTPEGTITMTP